MSYADATKTKNNADHICSTVKLAVKKTNKKEKIEEVEEKNTKHRSAWSSRKGCE